MGIGSTSGDQRVTGKTMNTVLIATERDLEQNLLAQALDGKGFAIIRSHDGLQALEMARANPPQLLIANVGLPLLDGFSLFKRCQQDEQLKQLPILLYSPRSNDQKSERFAQEVGARHFVSNGLKADVIVKAVDEALAGNSVAADSKPTAGAQVISIEVRQLREQSNKLQSELQQARSRLQALQTQLQSAQQEAQKLSAQPPSTSQTGYLFDQNPVAMWLVNAANNTMLAVNDAALRLFGYNREEFMALNHETLLRNHAVTPTTTTILSFQHRDGRALSLVLNSRDVEFNGHAAELVAAHDVTYRVRGERAIVDEAQRVKALLAAVPLPYWAIDQEGKLLDVNEHYCRMSGYRRDELIGTHITTLLADTASSDHAVQDKPAQSATLTHKDGTRYAVTLVMSPTAISEQSRVILIQPRDAAEKDGENSTAGSLRLNTVLEIMRYAGDADEATLLQYAIAQLAATFASPLAMFASVNAASQHFQIMAFTFVQSGKRTAIATNEPILLPDDFRNALSTQNAILRNDAGATQISSTPSLSLSRYLLCPAKQDEEQWFLLVGNRDTDYSAVDRQQLQSCVDILVTLLTLKRRQTQTQGLQHQAQSEATSLLGVLQRLLAQHDPFAVNGGVRVAALASAIAKHMGFDAERCTRLSTAAQLHDIGHLLIPQALLLRPTALEPGEQALMRTHVDRGVQLLEGLELGSDVLNTIAQHHERLDGSGYPKRLRGDEILMESRILAVADVVEAMCSNRAYRPARGLDAALNEIKSGGGKLYDAEVVNACLKVFNDTKQEWPQ